MELTQIYGEPGVPVSIQSDGQAMATAVENHKARLTNAFRNLTSEQWQAETRCSGWNALTLGHHVADAAGFFAFTLARSAEGEATRLLEGFDPKSTPDQRRSEAGVLTPEGVLESLAMSEGALGEAFAAFGSQDSSAWGNTAEVPFGHVPARTSLQHCLFDSWLHERDLLIPLGVEPTEVTAEIVDTVSYLCAMASIGSMLTAGMPAAGEKLTVQIEDHPARIEIRLGVPTVVVLSDDDDGAADVTAPGAALADAMAGRGDLSEFIEVGTRAHAVMSGALAFLS